MDKTVLNLLALLIAGAGIFAVLLKFSVPQLNMAFFDENPYAIKKDIIENIMTRTFMILALIGLLIQAYTIIFESKLAPNNYSTQIYIKFFFWGLVGVIVLVFALGGIGRCIAKKIWWPQIIQKQSESFTLAGEIIKNNGFYNNELEKIETYSEEQKQKLPPQRYKQCDEILTQIEELLEIHNIPETREERYKNLEKYFKNINT